MAIFRGAGVAIVTPFNEDGSVNFDNYGELIEWQIAEGTDAIISCGTTGEASTMTDEEQIEVVLCGQSQRPRPGNRRRGQQRYKTRRQPVGRS